MFRFYLLRRGTNTYTATQCPEDWRPGLHDPIGHWKPGCSAWALAHCWEAAKGLPPEIQSLLRSSANQDFQILAPVVGLIEHKTRLPGKGEPSHTDVLVFAKAADKLAVLAVEGKVDEPLGTELGKWNKGDKGTKNKQARLHGILELLGLPDNLPTTIYYQLLHRLAVAVIEARKHNARYAVMIIHSFSAEDKSFCHFEALLQQYGISNAYPGQLYQLRVIENITLYAGWARGDRRFLGQMTGEF